MNDINNFNANIELQHIYLEVYNERYHHLGAFIEAYYCHRHGLVTKQGKPDWLQIFTKGTRTLAAAAIVERKRLVRDLVVPLTVIVGYLKTLVRDDRLSLDTIKKVLDHYVIYIIMTRYEHEQLVNAGLKNVMPASYYQENHQDHFCFYARFNAVNILL